jgi:hypothetical protein
MTELIPGIDILNTGHGHTEVRFDKPEDLENAKAIITDMLRRGYRIFIEAADGTMTPVRKFNPKKNVYLIDGPPADEPVATPAMQKRSPGRPRKTPLAEVPVGAARAVSVGRSAGG